MVYALFFKGKMDSKYAILSSVTGFGAFLISENFLNIRIDSLIIGVTVSTITAIIGSYNKKGKLNGR
jgi:hypothetical protein